MDETYWPRRRREREEREEREEGKEMDSDPGDFIQEMA